MRQQLCVNGEGTPSQRQKLSELITFENTAYRNSLVGQRLRICLPLQGTLVKTLVQEDSTRCGASKPVCPRAHARHQEKPLEQPAHRSQEAVPAHRDHIAASKQPLLTAATLQLAGSPCSPRPQKSLDATETGWHSQKYRNTEILKMWPARDAL